MKKVFLILAASFIGLSAFSQTRQPGSELSIGAEAALPVGNLKDASNFGFGATVKYAYNFDETIAATLQSGYIYFPGKDLGGLKVNHGIIPLKAGVRFSIGQFYLEPQLGAAFVNQKWSETGNATNNSVSGNYTAFAYAGNVGVFATPNFDISLRYEGMSKNGTSSFLGLRLAYTFPLGK